MAEPEMLAQGSSFEGQLRSSRLPDPGEWPALSALLDEALDVPEGARDAWLAQQPISSASLRCSLAALLAAYREASGSKFLEGLSTAPRAPTRVGPWRLVCELGRGGMGTVWLAERHDGLLKRPVALKLPHAGLARRGFAERLARERDILAALEHPNIARLYDAGVTEQGQPYLALEYITGEDLLTHCDTRRLGVRARIDLFLQVLAAVQFAHGRLVIHRDLKPGNVLVSADGTVRLLDFGVAKLMTDGMTRDTELTALDGHALTPDFASPEQIAGKPLGTASDVYSLGVLLFELLTGDRPYRLARTSRGALEEAILQAPPRRMSQSVDNMQRASARSTTPQRLARTLRGDLDAIVSKALAKAPEDRYATAEAFARDLGRWLAGENVLARPEAAWRRVARFVRRHRLAFGVGASVIVLLSAALAVALWQARAARMEAVTANAVEGFLEEILRANSAENPDPAKARTTTARELLDRAADRIDVALADAPAARLRMVELVGRLYSDFGMHRRAAEFERRTVDLTRDLYGPADPRVAYALAEFANAIGVDDPA